MKGKDLQSVLGCRAMPRYVALLRGINVGGYKRVPMAQLRELLQGLGYTDVATLLQSGNAVFTSKEKSPARVTKKIEAAIAEEFGFEVSVIVRTRDELAATIQANPLPGAEDAPPGSSGPAGKRCS